MNKSRTLLKRARRLDNQALAEIYDTYAPAMYRYIYRMTGQRETAQDLAAETFHRLLKALKQGKGPERQLSAWLYRTAHNLVVDWYRRAPPQEPAMLETLAVADPAHYEHDLEQQEAWLAARAALDRLTPLQQQVLILRYLEDMSLADIAQITKRTVGAVKALQHRALNSLRRILEAKDENP